MTESTKLLTYRGFVLDYPVKPTKETKNQFARELVQAVNKSLDQFWSETGQEPNTLLVSDRGPVDQIRDWFEDGDLEIVVKKNLTPGTFGVTRI